MEVLIAAECLVVVLAVVVNMLRPAQRSVVLVGILAAAVQVFYPPCIQTDGTRPRQWLDPSLTYGPSVSGVWIDAGRQMTWLAATALVIVLACIVIWWRQRPEMSRVADSPGGQ